MKTMKILTIAALLVIAAATSQAQQTLVSTNAVQLQEMERAAVAWGRAIDNEIALAKAVEADTSKVFVIRKAKFTGDFSSKPIYGSKKEKLAAIAKDIEALKRARDKDLGSLAESIK